MATCCSGGSDTWERRTKNCSSLQACIKSSTDLVWTNVVRASRGLLRIREPNRMLQTLLKLRQVILWIVVDFRVHREPPMWTRRYLIHDILSFVHGSGFYFIPGALTDEEQGHWIRESLVSFPQPPNRTNHTTAYGPIFDLFDAVQNNKVLIELGMASSKVEPTQSEGDVKSDLNSQRYSFSQVPREILWRVLEKKGIRQEYLVRVVRWLSFGFRFSWPKRNYDVSLPHKKIPYALCLVAKKMAVPAMPNGEEFRPEAAIVNYFGPGDMLGGHLDDMEKDWSKPIVSISLGCKAIFLLGGKSREDMPIAMFLRSGDIVLMAGEARECFHGQFSLYYSYVFFQMDFLHNLERDRTAPVHSMSSVAIEMDQTLK
ncbi:Alpha-ketoglutarate-dependent dioxygenase alkB [Platanthera zijinensis]|uniref:Alpha-ketoglutarate-dependent dioxygenase alkB n=1 Tax=Platanthera zijinensis TaxID=2320716 RepID=A0AAP0B933_9ASPA